MPNWEKKLHQSQATLFTKIQASVLSGQACSACYSNTSMVKTQAPASTLQISVCQDLSQAQLHTNAGKYLSSKHHRGTELQCPFSITHLPSPQVKQGGGFALWVVTGNQCLDATVVSSTPFTKHRGSVHCSSSHKLESLLTKYK